MGIRLSLAKQSVAKLITYPVFVLSSSYFFITLDIALPTSNMLGLPPSVIDKERSNSPLSVVIAAYGTSFSSRKWSLHPAVQSKSRIHLQQGGKRPGRGVDTVN